MSIDNKSDWWNLLERNWSNILAIFNRVNFNLLGHFDVDGSPLETRLANHLEDLKTRRSYHLADYLQRAWGDAPDSPVIHSWPGWGALCDLCSETWVFEDEWLNEATNEAEVKS